METSNMRTHKDSPQFIWQPPLNWRSPDRISGSRQINLVAAARYLCGGRQLTVIVEIAFTMLKIMFLITSELERVRISCTQIEFLFVAKELGTVLTKICPVKINNQNTKLWYLNICNFKKMVIVYFHF